MSISSMLKVKKRPQSMTRIDNRLEAFLATQDLVDFYDQESCVQDNTDRKFLGKFEFKLLLVCSDRVYLCDNPPKDLNNFILFDDIFEITTIDDIPNFLNGAEKENATHICIRCSENPNSKKRQQLAEIKRRMLELKRSMVYSRALDSKLSEIELSTPRAYKNLCSAYMEDNGLDLTHRSTVTLDHLTALNTHRSNIDDPGLSTNLTNRSSVRFEPETDTVTERAVKTRYQNLSELLDKSSSANGEGESRTDPLSLSLPITPRALDGYPLTYTLDIKDNEINQRSARNLESIENRINLDFIKDSDKKESLIHIYVLNPKTKIFQTLKNAQFHAKIRSTLNYHQTFEEETQAQISKRLVKLNKFEKKFKELKAEIKANIDNLETLSKLFDELLCATNSYNVIKKLFWHTNEFYKLVVNEIIRYLPKSPARMDLNITSGERRIKELECRYLRYLFKSLLGQLELAQLQDELYDDNAYEISRKTKSMLSDLTVVTGILMWEILHFLSLSTWNSADFNLDLCVKAIDTSNVFIETFIPRLIAELTKTLNDNTQIVLTPKETVTIFKLFSFLQIVLKKSTKTTNLLKFLRSNHHEEFKYYFNEERIKLKTFNYYPIINDLMDTIKLLKAYIV